MAIQTGGTTRIGNSGELQNISSVDATTKNAIEAAGVGGVFSFQNYSSTSSTFAFSGTGFTYQDLETIQDPTGNSTPRNKRSFMTRMEGSENFGIN